MNQVFKPLGIAAAVAAASAGFANVASAQPAVANNALGDLALVPYYTVNDEWITGIHIVNTSDKTQVVKFRFRRAEDSLDALDFNIVMSPWDVYAGTLRDEGDTIFWSAGDTTCTVPAANADGQLVMPDIYRPGAETGYVEIIAMGAPTSETMPIAVAAKHSGQSANPALTPKDCGAVRSNFFANGVSGTTRGVIDNATSYQPTTTAVVGGDNTYEDSGDVLKVSYFIRDNATGIEFGDNAVHIAGFIEEPTITNQQFGYLSGDLNGFDFPDLDGSEAVNGTRGRFALLRDASVLGVGKLINEWTANPDNGAALDWVVTMPGQYLMFERLQYLATDAVVPGSTVKCNTGSLPNDVSLSDTGSCDFRDIPVTATLRPYSREESTVIPEEGDLVVSPQPPGERPVNILDQEVNVITWGAVPVLDAAKQISVPTPEGSPAGWASLSVTANAEKTQAICDFTALAAVPIEMPVECTATDTPVPLVGFVAWQRNFANLPAANYGRIVEHSYASS